MPIEDIVISELVRLTVLLKDLLLFGFEKALQLLGVFLILIVVCVCLIDLQRFFLQPKDSLVYLLSLWLVVPKLLSKNLLETLKGLIKGSGPLVFCDLLPGSLNIGYFSGIERLDVAVDHD